MKHCYIFFGSLPRIRRIFKATNGFHCSCLETMGMVHCWCFSLRIRYWTPPRGEFFHCFSGGFFWVLKIPRGQFGGFLDSYKVGP